MDSKMRTVLKTTEELVTQSRLNQIARDHKSIGSILDDRTVFPLEDPNWKYGRKSGKIELEKRLNGRRGGRIDGELIKEQVDHALENLQEKGVTVDLSTDYDLERGIWKSLSSEKEYFAKMNHQNPELQELRENLKGKEKEAFKESVKLAIVNLSEKFREECRQLKKELDSNGVFHPEANAHRVHCLYRLKLFKHLNCYSIEFPILKKMHEEKLRIAREEKRKADLLARFEQSGHWTIAMEKESSSSSVNVPGGMTSGNTNSGESAKTNDSSSGKANPLMKGSKSSLGVRFTDDNKSTSKSSTSSMSTSAHGSGKKGGSSSASSLPSAPPGHKLKPITGASELPTIEDDQENSSSGSSKKAILPGGPSTAPLTNAAVTDRVFQRIKRGKLGGADPRGLLPDEAQRLDKGEVTAVKKNRDKNDILENQVSSWMLGSLQESQIAKTALGGAGAIIPVPLPTSLGSSKNSPAAPSVGSQLSPLLHSFAKSVSPTNTNLVTNDPFSPKRLLPFDQFYKMFDEYRAIASTASASNFPHTPSTIYHSNNGNNSSAHSRASKGAVPAGSVDSKRKPSQAVNASGLPEKEPEEVTDTQNLPSSSSAATAVGTSSGAGAGAAPGSESIRPATLNIIKHLSEIDPQFAAYLKIAGYHKSNEVTMAKLSGEISKPKKARKLNLLGKDAVNLLSASAKSGRKRGGGAVSSQGFVNYFNVPSDGGTFSQSPSQPRGQQDGLEGAGGKPSTADKPRADDLLARLRGTDDGDMSSDSEDEEDTKKDSWGGRANGGILETDGLDSADNSSVLSSPQGSVRSGAGADTQLDIQSKLTAVWDSLLLSATSRIAFMRKYSQLAYCRNMSKAVDMWAETTVFLLSLVEMLAIEKKIKEGIYSATLDAKSLFALFRKRIPLLLSSSSPSLIPISMHRTSHNPNPNTAILNNNSNNGNNNGMIMGESGAGKGDGFSQNTSTQEAPLSAIAVVKVKFALERVFSSSKGMEIVRNLAECAEKERINLSLKLIHLTIDELLPELSNSLLRAQQELDDSIPYKNKTCKEWMLELALRERDVALK